MWRAAASVGLAVGFLTGSLSATDHPVSSRTDLDAAFQAVQPGDTISLRTGTWPDTDLLFEAEGTADQPITLRAASPGETVFSGRSRLRIAGQHLVVSGLVFRSAWNSEDLVEFRRDSKRVSTDCRLTDCALIDCNAPDGTRQTRWIGIYGQRNRLDHCSIQGKTSPGTTVVVWLDGSGTDSAHRIDHNHFGPRPRLGKNGGETLRIGDSKTSMTVARNVIEDNLFEACDGEAEIISNKSCGNLYRRNTFLRCSGALTLRHGNGCVVEENVFLGEGKSGTGGIRVVGEGHRIRGNWFENLAGEEQRAGLCLMNGLKDSPLNGYFQVRDLLVTDNTWLNCRQPVYVGLMDEDRGNNLPPVNVRIAGNRIIGATPAITTGTASDIVWEDNTVSETGEAGPTPGPTDLRDTGPAWRK